MTGFARKGLAAALLAGPAAVATPPANLCAAGEEVVFACPVGAKLVSLCGTARKPPAASAIQYRFGSGRRIELAYPADPRARAAAAFRAGSLTFARGDGGWLRFDRAGYRYTIFTATGAWGRDGAPAGAAGVAVGRGGRDIAALRCRGAASGDLSIAQFQRYGLPEATGEPFEIPDAFLPR